MEIIEQTRQWVLGNSIHNKERDECCPDFSCCRPELLAPLEDRKRFYQAEKDGDEKTKSEMLGNFLGLMVANSNIEKKVYIAGNPPPGEKED